MSELATGEFNVLVFLHNLRLNDWVWLMRLMTNVVAQMRVSNGAIDCLGALKYIWRFGKMSSQCLNNEIERLFCHPLYSVPHREVA